jgi:hypothetical protein
VTRDDFERKWATIPTEHAPGCDFMEWELCTCGFHAARAVRAHDLFEIERAERRAIEEAAYKTRRRKERLERFARKVVFFSGLFWLGTYHPWIAIAALSAWLSVWTLFWLVEAHGPLYSNPELRSVRGYLYFVLW